MKAIIVIFILLLIPQACATLDDATHILIYGKSAPAADVVAGANFAAYMKANYGQMYTSAIDTDAYKQIKSMDGKTIVLVEGKTMKLLGDDDNVVAYFKEKGFDVEVQPSPTLDDLNIYRTDAITTGSVQQDPTEYYDQDGNVIPINPKATSEGTDDPQPGDDDWTVQGDEAALIANGTEQKSEPKTQVKPDAPDNQEPTKETEKPVTQDIVQEKPGFFTMIWRWIMDKF